MGTRVDLRTAGRVAFLTAGLLTTSLVLFAGGPPSTHPQAVLPWFTEHAGAVKLSAALGLIAMVGLVAFAIAFREAMWVFVADRTWTTLVVLQSAAVLGTVALVAAGIVWSLADQASAGAVTPELAGSLWALGRILFRVSTWGLAVPLAMASFALYQHSSMGQVAGVASALVILALFFPGAGAVGVYAFCGWLAVVGVALVLSPKAEQPLVPVAHP